MRNFWKGIIVGIGGIAPGLSGSILLVIFGLYTKMIEAMGTFFKNFKKNFLFLAPLFIGFGVGILLFSKVVDYLIVNYEMCTRYTFLGLIVGTIPLFYKEVKQKGFHKRYYILIGIAFVLGTLVFFFNKNLFPVLENPNLFQSIFLGVMVAASTIIPGVDSAAILSSLGMYEIYVNSIATINLSILIPAGIGLAIGALIISFLLNKLIEKHYTITFSVIFGLFLATIPNILNESCKLGLNASSVIAILCMIVGFGISYALGKLKENPELLKKVITYFEKLNKKQSSVEEK